MNVCFTTDGLSDCIISNLLIERMWASDWSCSRELTISGICQTRPFYGKAAVVDTACFKGANDLKSGELSTPASFLPRINSE